MDALGSVFQVWSSCQNLLDVELSFWVEQQRYTRMPFRHTALRRPLRSLACRQLSLWALARTHIPAPLRFRSICYHIY